MASASAKLLVLVATSGFLWEPISCGWLQKRQDIQYANILLPAEGASNSTYQIPSLTPLPPDPAAATTPPPSPAPGGSSDPSLAEDPPGIAASSSAIEASVVTPVTAAASSDPAAAANSSPGCTPYEPCNLFFQTVSVYYWPQEQQNTACLTSMAAAPSAAPPDGLAISSPSVYVVFESIKASDGCNQIGPSFMSKTATFPPGALSTLAPDNSTQSFNLADLPCPPASVQWDSPGPYAPLLAPPPYLFDLDPAFSACIAGYSQGVDPPTPLSAARGVSGPGGPGHLGRKRTVVHAHPHAHARPWSPQKTA